MAGLLQGKIALVTGGGSGIGRATALKLAREGAKVMIADYIPEGGERTVRMIKEAGGDASFVGADVSIAREAEAMVAETIKRYGRIDCAFNNAGIEGKVANTVDCTEEVFDRVIAINLKGVWLCMKYEIPQMLKQGGGSIVNTASIAGLVGFEGLPAYNASKGGVIQLTRTAALEFATKKIRVNCVCPGVIRTPMVERLLDTQGFSEQDLTLGEPVGRMGKPEEIAEGVLWLLSDAASFATGHPLVIDGAWVAR
ncbi:MAG: SDR family oxidoreductase [Candidatus Binatus sp.]|uniref:SDR family oxidoreductase n=1 Tax=Candidatus Binatus sp. TaxID=2811406 RepID=UPI00271F54F6|nr:SDR family oxidoreductase [Candidatus Binatus sp.]MDO8434809.1 SDR family oxidoreductase [Candidatus Binatus sp.]